MATLGRQAIAKDVGGTLYFDVPESGTPSSATIAIYDEGGAATSVTAGVVTVSSSQLSYAVAAGVVDQLGDNWRAVWTYVISGTTYTEDALFAVVKRVSRPTLTDAKLVGYHAALVKGRFVSGQTDHANARAAAWAELCDGLLTRGLSIHRFRDPAFFESLHADLTAARILESLAPGTATTNDWQARAADLRARAYDRLREIKAEPGWYDAAEDLVPNDTQGPLTSPRLVM